MRPVHIETGPSRHAEGSALITAGNTRVLCLVSIEDRVPDFLRGKKRGWLTAEYAMLPRATHTRSPRERAGGKPNSRALEISRLIGRSLRQAVDMPAVGERTLTVDCDVLDADGGTRCAAITGGMVALALALRRLAASPVRLISAVSVGYVAGKPVLDLCYEDDHKAEVDLNVVMTDRGRYVELQGTAEGEPFTDRQLSTLRRLAAAGCAYLGQEQRRAIIAAGEGGRGA
jgi:ribonuclease PH